MEISVKYIDVNITFGNLMVTSKERIYIGDMEGYIIDFKEREKNLIKMLKSNDQVIKEMASDIIVNHIYENYLKKDRVLKIHTSRYRLKIALHNDKFYLVLE